MPLLLQPTEMSQVSAAILFEKKCVAVHPVGVWINGWNSPDESLSVCCLCHGPRGLNNDHMMMMMMMECCDNAAT